MAKKTSPGTGGDMHYHYHYYGNGTAQAAATEEPPEPPPAGAPWVNLHRHPNADSLIKGLLIGAGAAYLLTNETAQRTIIRSAVHLWGTLQGAVEELKERMRDAEAEVAASAEPPRPAEAGVAGEP